jgi:hypothetical protein
VAVWVRLRTYAQETNDVVQTASIAGTSSASTSDDAGTHSSSEPYTMVPADSAGRPLPAGAETSAQRSARERRYNELLHSAPPPSTVQPTATPSFLDRVVAPIASALGVTRPKPQPQQAPPPRQAPPQGRGANDPQSRNGSGNENSSTDEKTRAQEEEDDPDTDLTPPHLLTADFNPPQVQDGEETVFAAIVNDNRSGVRSVSGVITSPSGSMQGFSCTREGETNRFLARVTVPKDAAEGRWVVKYLSMSDNASNNVNLNQQTGLPASASFLVVSSSSDATGPQLKALWLERQAMRAGDRNTVFIQAEDDKAGVSIVSGVFVSPSRSARIGFGCRANSTGTWECSVSPPTCLDCGIWTVEQIQLQDKANNMTTFRGSDNQLVRAVTLDISGERCDSSPPVVTSLTLSPTVVSNSQKTIISVRATMFDEGGCGASSLSAQAIPPGGAGGQRNPVLFTLGADGETFEGKLEIPQFAAKGQWSFAWVQALDKGLNLRSYSASDPVVARATFQVE